MNVLRGDAPICAHLLEFCSLKDLCAYGYDKNGNTIGTVQRIPKPERLKWEINTDLQVLHYSILCARGNRMPVAMNCLNCQKYIFKTSTTDAFITLLIIFLSFMLKNPFSYLDTLYLYALILEG